MTKEKPRISSIRNQTRDITTNLEDIREHYKQLYTHKFNNLVDMCWFLRKYNATQPRVCMHAKSFQSCPTLCDPKDCSPPGSSVHGILQARILEWVALPSSRESSRPRDWTCISLWHLLHWQAGSLPLAPPGKPLACMQWKPKISAE